MSQTSRTAKSLKNSIVALTMYFVNLVLQFFSRKILLDYLGTEILGLNSTAYNLLQFLNIAELGIGSAIGSTLYKPLFEKDKQSISEIIALQGKFYQRIAIFIIAGAAAIMPFFPLIFKKMTLPLWYAYASFAALLFSALLSYFVNYKQILLSADQKEYKIQYTYRLSMMVKVAVQMLAIITLPNGYIWWLILEIIFAIIGSIALSKTIRNEYPYLQTINATFKTLRAKYSDIETKVKQVFFHKVSSFALFQLSPLIIYAYTSLTEVAIYGNYVLITSGITYLFGAMLNNVSSGIGNLIAERPYDVLGIFGELFSLRFFLASIGAFMFFMLASPFVKLWIGSTYEMPSHTIILLSAILFIGLARQTIDNFLYAYGLFRDIWAPIIEMTINIVASIILGAFYGLNGVLFGALISILIIVMGWKPYFLFNAGIKCSVWRYWSMFAKHTAILIACAIFSIIIINLIGIDASASIDSLLLSIPIYTIIFSGSLLALMNVTRCPIINFEKRIIRLIK